MTHIVHPYSHRLGITRDWRSRWFAIKNNFRNFLKTDVLIRDFLEKKLRDMYVSDIKIERNDKALSIVIITSRAGMIIGKNGEGIANLKANLDKFIKKEKLSIPRDIKLDIQEVRSPESDAAIVSAMIVEGLEKRMPFRRVLKQTVDKVMANRDVLGVRIRISGRIGGAEMSRRETIKKGRVPLQTFRSDIDYSYRTAVYPGAGITGVKVWIYRGEVFNKEKNQ